MTKKTIFMKAIQQIIVFFLLLLISACGNKNSKPYLPGKFQHLKKARTTIANTKAKLPLSNELQEQKQTPLDTKKIFGVKLIKEGYIEFETDDFNATRQNVNKAIEKYNAYISSDREFHYPDRRSNTLVIRIPASQFDPFVEEITQHVEHFDRKEIKVNDVTEEFIDIQARLKTKKETEKRFLELLKKARNVSEILEVENQIEQLRAEIESLEGRLNYLKNQTIYSTLNLTFYERIPVEHKNHFIEKFKKGFKNGWNNLVWFLVILVNLWPFVLLLALLIFWSKRRHQKNTAKRK